MKPTVDAFIQFIELPSFGQPEVPAVGTPTDQRHAEANSGTAGEAGFGQVANCPCCGRPWASVPAATATYPPPEQADFAGSASADNEGPSVQGLPQGAGPMASAHQGAAGRPANEARTLAACVATIRGYAGRLRSFASTLRPSRAPAGAAAGRRRVAWKPLVLATVSAAVLFVLGELAGTAGNGPAPQAAMRAPGGGDAVARGAVEGGAGVAASVPAVPAMPAVRRAEIEPPAQQQAAPPPAPHRSLCSAANEAAGLCAAQ